MGEKRKKCWKPVALGPQGIAICILDEGHEGTCNGGKMEEEIGKSFAASVAESEMEWG